MAKSVSITALILVSITLFGQKQPETVYPFRPADSSPRLAKLRSEIAKGGAAAVDEFCNEMRRNGTPLVEAITGDDKHSLVTFVWRGSAEAKNVVITDGVSIGVGGVEPLNSEMTRIQDTDVSGIELMTSGTMRALPIRCQRTTRWRHSPIRIGSPTLRPIRSIRISLQQGKAAGFSPTVRISRYVPTISRSASVLPSF